MNDTPTSKVEALREQLMQDLSQHRLVEHGKTCNPADVEVFVQAFATFLEGVQSQTETFSKDGKPLSDTNSIEAVPVEALNQVVTALRGGE